MKTIKHFQFNEPPLVMGFKEDIYIRYENKIIHNLKTRGEERLSIHDESLVETCLIRALMGNLHIKNPQCSIDFITKKNYFINPIVSHNESLIQSFYKTFQVNSLSDLSLLRKAITDNRQNSGVFINILFELSHALDANERKEHLKSFIHIYRLYEHLAFMFPLMYLKTNNSYSQSYDALKKYFSDGGDSELKFGKQFIDKLLGGTLLSSSVDFSFNENIEENKKIIKSIDYGHLISSEGSYISIPIGDIWDFVITIRNRYFHNLHGMGNSITAQNMSNPDSFFSGINTPSLHLFSLIYLHILLSRMR